MPKKKVIAKYAYGTPKGGVGVNYLESPAGELAQHDINIAKGQSQAANNPWTSAMALLGQAAVGYGMNNIMAYGGTINGNAVNVEGNEVAELPNGQNIEFKGPAHEQGGIDTVLPDATDIFSDRIKVDGKTMAERQKFRLKSVTDLKKKLEDNPTDIVLKNTLTKIEANNQKQEHADKQIQTMVNIVEKGTKEGFALGTSMGGLQGGPAVDTNQWEDILKNLQGSEGLNLGQKIGDADLGGMNFGNALGIAGNLYSTFAPMQNTLANRAGDTPNINAFDSYGQEGLEKINESKQFLGQMQADNLESIASNQAAAMKTNRANSRGLNTMRAMNLATQSQANQAEADVYSNFANMFMNILGTEANMLNQQDQIVMQGEQNRDLADRQDRDNFYTNLGRDKSTIGTGLQETGKDLNVMQQDQAMLNLLNQLSKYGITVDNKGNLGQDG